MISEKLIRSGNRVVPQFALSEGKHLATRRESLLNRPSRIARANHATRQQTRQFPIFVHYGKGAECEALSLNQLNHITNDLRWSYSDRILD